MRFLLCALLINAASFVVMRICWKVTGQLGAEVVFPRQNSQQLKDRNEGIFLLAGNLAQPEGAFEFLDPMLARKQHAFLKFKLVGVRATLRGR